MYTVIYHVAFISHHRKKITYNSPLVLEKVLICARKKKRKSSKNKKVLHQQRKAPLLLGRQSVNLHGCSVTSVWMVKAVDRAMDGLMHKHYHQGVAG